VLNHKPLFFRAILIAWEALPSNDKICHFMPPVDLSGHILAHPPAKNHILLRGIAIVTQDIVGGIW
jgi:hypothetical protein